MALDTLPGWLTHQATQQRLEIAIRHKQLGIWQQLSWNAVHQQVLTAVRVLKASGFGQGDTLYLLSFPRPEAITLSLAAQWLGGVSAPLDPSHNATDIQTLLKVLAPAYLFAEGKPQVDLALQASQDHALILYADQRGLSAYQQPALHSYADILGDSQQASLSADTEASLAKPQDEAFRFYRLGRLGGKDDNNHAKLEFQSLVHQEMLSHGRQLIAAESLVNSEEALATRAFATSAHARYLLAPWLIAGFKLNFPEKIETRDQDRRELGPTLVAGTKTTFMRLQAQVQDRLPLPGTPWRQLVDWALATDTRSSQFRKWLAELIIIRPLRDVLGFSRTRVPLLVGEALPAASAAFFAALGVKVRNWPDVTDWQASAVSGQDASPAAGTVHAGTGKKTNSKSNKSKANTYKAVNDSTANAKAKAAVVGNTLRRLGAGLPDSLNNIGKSA